MTMNATFKRPSMALEMEFGSLKELAGYIQEEGTALATIFGDDMELVVKALGGNVEGQGEQAQGEGDKPKGKRGPKPKNQPDPATAQAPAPLPIPPADMTSADGGIPPGLRRDPATNAAPAMVAPPPPPPPPAPVVVPPSGILAGKVIANLDARKAGTTDDGKGLVEWLAASGIVNAGSTYDESIAAIRLMADDKLAAVATALAVA